MRAQCFLHLLPEWKSNSTVQFSQQSLCLSTKAESYISFTQIIKQECEFLGRIFFSFLFRQIRSISDSTEEVRGWKCESVHSMSHDFLGWWVFNDWRLTESLWLHTMWLSTDSSQRGQRHLELLGGLETEWCFNDGTSNSCRLSAATEIQNSTQKNRRNKPWRENSGSFFCSSTFVRV